MHKVVYRGERNPYEGGKACIRVSNAENGTLMEEEEDA